MQKCKIIYQCNNILTVDWIVASFDQYIETWYCVCGSKIVFERGAIQTGLVSRQFVHIFWNCSVVFGLCDILADQRTVYRGSKLRKERIRFDFILQKKFTVATKLYKRFRTFFDYRISGNFISCCDLRIQPSFLWRRSGPQHIKVL